MSIPSFENFRRSLRGTPMAREARGIYDAALRGGINPALVVGIAGAESSFGSRGYAVGRNNPFGLMGFSFKNYSQATTKLAQTLKNRELKYPQAYAKSGLRGIIGIYTPYGAANGPGNDPSAHTQNIINIGRKTGGDPSQVYTDGRNIPIPQPGAAQPPMPRSASRGAQPVGGGELGSLLARQYLEMGRGASVGEMEATASEIARAIGARQRSVAMARTAGSGVAGPPSPAGSGATAAGQGGVLDYGSMNGIVRPLPTKLGGSDYGYSDPEGQDGRHLAKDWFAPGNTPIASPVTGTVFRVNPDKAVGQKASGQIFGGSVYIRDQSGRIFVFRHVENPQAYTQAGRRVTAGQRIGGVKPWSGSSHAHIELYKPGPYEYSSARAMDPHAFFTKAGIR